MRKLLLNLVLIAGVVLSACAKATPTSPPTMTAPAPTVVLEVPEASSLNEPGSGCTVIAKQPTPGPTQESLFPPVTDADHVKGPETAKVTIIEYSDFQ